MESINLTILTGAGISAESGIPTFRDSVDGLWENYNIDDVATPEGFARNPKLVHDFYNARRDQLNDAEPNAAHYAIVKLEQYWLKNQIGRFLLVTQNIDNLHERAGSKIVYHMHGELMKIQCLNCHEVSPFRGHSRPEHICPVCMRTSFLRPHVVWFGEMPLYMDFIQHALYRTHHYMAIGTSGTVMPASLFADWVSRNGMYDKELGEIVEITKKPTNDAAFSISIDGNATEAVPNYVDLLIEQVEELRGDRNV